MWWRYGLVLVSRVLTLSSLHHFSHQGNHQRFGSKF